MRERTIFSKIPFWFSLMLLFAFSEGIAQQTKEQELELKESQEYLSDASDAIEDDDFSSGEAEYRKAISVNPKDETGKYNLGTAYYNKEKNEEAMRRFKQAASVATNKPEKHKAFHNLGNTFMNAKDYGAAVEAYKNALRNNPTDDETRYNLALAKKMQDDNKGGGDDDQDKDSNKEQEQEQDNKQDKEDENEGDKGDQEDQKDQGDQEDQNQGDKDKDQKNPEQKKDQKEGDKPQQPVPGQLSPQQIKNLLDAMNNEEKKVQDKINAKKQKGAKVKPDKDW